MNADDLAKLKIKLREAVAARPPGARVAIVGWTPAAFELASDPVFSTGAAVLSGIFVPEVSVEQALIKRLNAIAAEKPDIVVIADDAEKEPLLEAVAALLPAETKLLIGGFSHFNFRDDIFDRIRQELFIPSFANGYQNSLVHLYQCLQNAHRQGLKGVVAEFWMFECGTTML